MPVTTSTLIQLILACPLGRFSMVCRDARTHKAHPVNPLVIRTAEEQALYTMGKSQ